MADPLIEARAAAARLAGQSALEPAVPEDLLTRYRALTGYKTRSTRSPARVLRLTGQDRGREYGPGVPLMAPCSWPRSGPAPSSRLPRECVLMARFGLRR
jgi:hypothetical protein